MLLASIWWYIIPPLRTTYGFIIPFSVLFQELVRYPLRQTQRKQAQRKQAQRKQAQRKQAQRKQAQRKQAQRKQAQRKQAQRKQAQRKQAQRKQAQRKQAQRKQTEFLFDELWSHMDFTNYMHGRSELTTPQSS